MNKKRHRFAEQYRLSSDTQLVFRILITQIDYSESRLLFQDKISN